MSLDEIARRFDQRDGFELIDYSPVVLPVVRLTVDAVTNVVRAIPPAKEFVMRSFALGLHRASDIAGFLGLTDVVVQELVGGLYEEGYLHAVGDGRGSVLSERGREVLNTAQQSTPYDEMLVFLYDRLLRRPVRLIARDLLEEEDIDHQQVIEIRPYPAEGPQVDELATDGVLAALEGQGEMDSYKEILRFKRIVQRVPLFRPAVGLVFKKIGEPEIQIAFAINGSLNQELEYAFARSGGATRLGFVRGINDGLVSTCVSAIGEKTGQSVPPLALATRALNTWPIRPVAAYETSVLVTKALESCQHTLAISALNLDEIAANRHLLVGLKAALRRNVKLFISLAQPPIAGRSIRGASIKRLLSEVEFVQHRSNGLHFTICDQSFALVANRPAIGAQGERRTFNRFRAYLLQTKELVTTFADEIGLRSALNSRRPQ